MTCIYFYIITLFPFDLWTYRLRETGHIQYLIPTTALLYEIVEQILPFVVHYGSELYGSSNPPIAPYGTTC